MKDLLLIGGGGHCRSCIDVIETGGHFRIQGIVQPLSDGEVEVLGYPVLGSDDKLHSLLKETPNALITVGQIRSADIRIRLFDLLMKLGANLPVIVSSTAYCSKHATINDGTIIMHGGIVNSGAIVGANCIINSNALIEHDSAISDHCHISTGARINGGVSIGFGTFIGSGSIIKEGVTIGQNVVVSAGQIVLRDIPDGAFVKHV